MGKAVVFHDHRGSWRITGATNNLETSLFIGRRCLGHTVNCRL